MSEIERLAVVVDDFLHAEARRWDAFVETHRDSDEWRCGIETAVPLKGLVRAILAAMREPSDAMKNAATAKMGDPPEFGNYEARFVWQAMIDAALREEVPA